MLDAFDTVPPNTNSLTHASVRQQHCFYLPSSLQSGSRALQKRKWRDLFQALPLGILDHVHPARSRLTPLADGDLHQ